MEVCFNFRNNLYKYILSDVLNDVTNMRYLVQKNSTY